MAIRVVSGSPAWRRSWRHSSARNSSWRRCGKHAVFMRYMSHTTPASSCVDTPRRAHAKCVCASAVGTLAGMSTEAWASMRQPGGGAGGACPRCVHHTASSVYMRQLMAGGGCSANRCGASSMGATCHPKCRMSASREASQRSICVMTLPSRGTGRVSPRRAFPRMRASDALARATSDVGVWPGAGAWARAAWNASHKAEGSAASYVRDTHASRRITSVWQSPSSCASLYQIGPCMPGAGAGQGDGAG